MIKIPRRVVKGIRPIIVLAREREGEKLKNYFFKKIPPCLFALFGSHVVQNFGNIFPNATAAAHVSRSCRLHGWLD